MIKLTPCMEKIFNISIDLFSTKNYELASLGDVAAILGRTKPSIYAHFKSKQEILDTIYDYFCENYCEGIKPLEEIEPVLKKGSSFEILEALSNNYVKNIINNDMMMKITKIIYQRTFCDNRAHYIAKVLMSDSAVKYIETALNRAVEFGRFLPFDTRFFAIMITNSRFCMLRSWLLNPTEDTQQEIMKHKQNMDDFIALELNRYFT